jgi:hypothetical protein
VLRKTIAYTDLDGDEVSEDFYFHISAAEALRLESSEDVGLSAKLQAIVASNDKRRIIEAFEYFIRTTFGVRSADGKRFIKTPEAAEEFMQSEAYSALLLELITDINAAAEFVQGVLPKGLAEKVQNLEAKMPDATGVVDGTSVALDHKTASDSVVEPRTFSMAEMIAMSDVDFVAKFGSDYKKYDAEVLRAAFVRKTSGYGS